MSKILNWLDMRNYKGKINGNNKKYSRSSLLVGYGAIVHSSKFRRLSNKSQVFPLPKSDYIRTRLTHSVEVSQIGKQLARFLSEQVKEKTYSSVFKTKRNFCIDFDDLVSSACLSHDLGQAPFGHAGERALDDLANRLTSCFEANKQNVRLLVGSIARKPFEVPVCLVDSIMKYKSKTTFASKNGAWFPEDEEKVQRVLNMVKTGTQRNPACFLMEAADDIAYICGDMEDAIKQGLIGQNALLKLLKDIPVLNNSYRKDEGLTWRMLIKEAWADDPGQLTSHVVKALVKHTCDGIQKMCKNKSIYDLPEIMSDFMHKNQHPKEPLNLLYWGTNKVSINHSLKKLKSEMYKSVLGSRDLLETEILGKKVIDGLWAEFLPIFDNHKGEFKKLKIFRILPQHVQQKIEMLKEKHVLVEDGEKARLLCDYISGMTDRFALDLWYRLNEPMRLKLAV